MQNEQFRHAFAQSAEIFEYPSGYICYKYNARIKRAGDNIKVSFYENGILTGFPKHKNSEKERAARDRAAYDPAERFKKTGLTARRRLYDLVACNLGKHKDQNAKKQTFKFLTLTFREDVRDLSEANKRFKDFIKRLNYHFTGESDSAFLRWVAVPELQAGNGRNVWHYHVLFFNLPFIPVSRDMVLRLQESGALPADYDARDTIFYLWRNGNVKINAVKLSDSYDLAGYVAKYIGKGLEGSFEYAADHDLLNRKRFLHSAGLLGPDWQIAFMTKAERAAVWEFVKQYAKHCKRKNGTIGVYFDSFFMSHEYIGRFFGASLRLSLKRGSELFDVFNNLSYGF